jgi:hypothetical protein
MYFNLLFHQIVLFIATSESEHLRLCVAILLYLTHYQISTFASIDQGTNSELTNLSILKPDSFQYPEMNPKAYLITQSANCST